MSTFQPEMAGRFAALLDAREAQLRALLAQDAAEERTLVVTADRGQDVTDFKDLAQEETAATIHDMQHTHAVKELEAVQAARHRLQAGSFGLCVSCGEPIELRRLEALPTAMRCMACQSIPERGQ